MSGLRVGYLVIRDSLLQERVGKLLRCVVNGVNSLAQWAAIAALDTDWKEYQPQMLAEYEVRRTLFYDTLRQITGLKPFNPDGSFFIWAEVENELLDRLGLQSVDELCDRLAAQGIGSTPGSAFSDVYPNYIRFSFSCSTKMVNAGLQRLTELLVPSPVLDTK
jgi:aspartate aminotransferase